MTDYGNKCLQLTPCDNSPRNNVLPLIGRGIRMAVEGLIRKIIPAQPGFFVIQLDSVAEHMPVFFDEDHFSWTEVVAWCVDAWTYPGDDCRVMALTRPITIEGDVEGDFAIVDSHGRATRPHCDSFRSPRDAMRAMWADKIKLNELIPKCEVA